MRDSRRGETKEVEHVVRECKAMAGMVGKESGQGAGSEINQGDWKTPKLGVKMEQWDVRQDLANNQAVLGRCCFDFDTECHRVELDFEAVKRVKLETTFLHGRKQT